MIDQPPCVSACRSSEIAAEPYIGWAAWTRSTIGWSPTVVVDDLDRRSPWASGGRSTRAVGRRTPAQRNGADRHHPGRHTEVGEQHVDVAEDAEVQRPESLSLDEQQQV